MSPAARTLIPPTESVTRELRLQGRRTRSGVSSLTKWLWVVPALIVYSAFVLFPLAQSIRYSFYDWDGIGTATWVGLGNYAQVFSNPLLVGSIQNSIVLIAFFTFIPTILGLATAQLIRNVRSGRLSSFARTTLFVPQIIPLAGAAVAWSWMYSTNGLVNQFLRLIGLGFLARAWLADFSYALPAVGFIGSWVAYGLCTMLFTAGIAKIDVSLYEAARIDGAGSIREFLAVTLPGLRNEIAVVVTVLTIGALASFDIVYVATLGGPGYQTMVPGVLIYRLTFTSQQVGLASALALVLAVFVIAIIAPIQRFSRKE